MVNMNLSKNARYVGSMTHNTKVFGIIGGTPQPWTNKVPVSGLMPKHKQLFVEQLNLLSTAILNGDNSFSFKTPTNPVAMKPDF